MSKDRLSICDERKIVNLALLNHFFHGFRMESTMMSAIIKTKIMEIIMHFLDFFCKLFAVCRASVPDCTWSTAFVTCGPKTNNTIYSMSFFSNCTRVKLDLFNVMRGKVGMH